MKRALTILFAVIVLTGSSSAMTFINILVQHTNGTDFVYVNGRASDETSFANVMKKIGSIDSKQFIMLRIGPNVPSSTAFRMLKIVRDSGMENITVVLTDDGYDLSLSFASPSNTIDASREWMLEHTTAVKSEHEEQQEIKEVEHVPPGGRGEAPRP